MVWIVVPEKTFVEITLLNNVTSECFTFYYVTRLTFTVCVCVCVCVCVFVCVCVCVCVFTFISVTSEKNSFSPSALTKIFRKLKHFMTRICLFVCLFEWGGVTLPSFFFFCICATMKIKLQIPLLLVVYEGPLQRTIND